MLHRALLLAVLAILAGCEKKEVAGPQGEPGTAGRNASVTTTTLFVPSGSWSVSSDSLVWSAVVFSPLITREIADKGIVKLSVLRGNTWWELPLTEDRELLTQFGIEQGQIQLEVVELHGAAPKPADQQFKMIIIPPQ
jgi:hypothetical protein